MSGRYGKLTAAVSTTMPARATSAMATHRLVRPGIVCPPASVSVSRCHALRGVAAVGMVSSNGSVTTPRGWRRRAEPSHPWPTIGSSHASSRRPSSSSCSARAWAASHSRARSVRGERRCLPSCSRATTSGSRRVPISPGVASGATTATWRLMAGVAAQGADVLDQELLEVCVAFAPSWRTRCGPVSRRAKSCRARPRSQEDR
jgi:hypothetical protein